MIIITGGAGFIGSCFLKKLNDEGIDNIHVVDHLGNGEKWKNLIGKKFTLCIDKDVFREKIISGFYNTEEIETIFHFGACSNTTEKDADFLLDNNYQYSIDLATYAQENGIRFIYASSAATYGSGENGYNDNEFDLLMPLNMYGFSKHLFDRWVKDNSLDDRFVGIKFFNVFGPNEYHKGEMSSMIYRSFNQISETGKVRLFKSYKQEYKDGEQVRDFVYIKDAIEIIYKFYLDMEISGIYNLGTGKARSWNDLAKSVFRASGKIENIEYIDMPENLKKQYQYFTQAEKGKLSLAGINYQYRSLEDSVKDYVQNYLMKDWKYF